MLLFSFIAALPAILMVIIASVTLNKGLDRWFSVRTQAIIDTSRAVAQAYVKSTAGCLALDLLAIAGEFNRVTPDIDANLRHRRLPYQSGEAPRAFDDPAHPPRPEPDREGETASNLEVPPPPADIFDGLDSGQPALIAPGTTNLVGGVIKLAGFDDIYLYLARPIDPRVTRNLRLTEENAAEYEQLQANRFGVQVAFGDRLRRRGARGAPVRHLDRSRICPRPRVTDPAADRGGAGGFGRQSRRACADARRRLAT